MPALTEQRNTGEFNSEVQHLTQRSGPGAVTWAASPPPNVATANARRSRIFPRKGRGSQGVIAIQCSGRNGALVAAVATNARHDLMLISNQGTLVRTRVAEISQVGRNTQGVTLIRLLDGEKLAGVVRIENEGDDGAETNGAGVDAM